jgi:hypothetical protein
MALLTNFGLSFLCQLWVLLFLLAFNLFPWHIIFHPFTFRMCVSLPERYVSYRQQKVGSCFLIQLSILCLRILELKLFTFGVMIEKFYYFLLFINFFFQVDSSIAYSSLLPLFIFRICWFAKLNIFDSFLILMSSSFLEIYSFLGSCVCDCLSSSSVCVLFP